MVLINVSLILPEPLAAALLTPGTAARLQANVAPGVALVAIYVNAFPLVAVADKLLDNTGIELGAAEPLPAWLVQPSSVCVTVYVPAVVVVIDDSVPPLFHNNVPVKPLAVNTELPQLLITDTPGATGIAFGAAKVLAEGLVQPSMVCDTV